MAKLKAITTRYNGYRFRSRLEARWACFFDTLGIAYRYEVEGFNLGDGLKYLPDFWLPHTVDGLAADGWGFWAEVKPLEIQPVELEKLTRLVSQSRHNALVFQGEPWPGKYTVLKISGCHFRPTIQIPGLVFTSEPLSKSRLIHLSNGGFSSHPTVLASCDRVLTEAFEAARGARFEFGESGEAA